MTELRKRTFCRVCEPACGLIATVDGGELIKLEADKDHPVSKGFVCPSLGIRKAASASVVFANGQSRCASDMEISGGITTFARRSFLFESSMVYFSSFFAGLPITV